MTYDPPIVVNEPLGKRWLQPLRWHLTALAFFLPFALMLAIHRYLGLSDAMMVAPAPGQPHSILYNILMIGTFWFGVGGYLLHVLLIADRTPIWLFIKLALLAASWALLILMVP
ncbi:hypothetical protein LOC68_03295 [Blastopirellula sp. JC732]|uniref:Uncharacterized protein n=1 Tax=Blastopirellula sediminis TaxID=2894196 RepID=A0A9X1MIJ1_9BACT|nr:hypothetical protein [Blastopirellula sediminis]MCC9607796.1 hypothetical protein [Blastopirellula sediminis]MCC9627411.1 hypothetical protein [Blastopirellula sediminis]